MLCRAVLVCSFETVFVAQRWIATPKASLSPAHAVMVLFAATRLPQDETPFVQKLRAEELAKLRGEGLEAAVLSGQRKGADNVYDYQVCVCLWVWRGGGRAQPATPRQQEPCHISVLQLLVNRMPPVCLHLYCLFAYCILPAHVLLLLLHVYCHTYKQTYNDLGKEGMPRPTLGGPEWPYPRRLATHVGSQGPDGSGVEPNVKQPWLPYDEAFSFTKVCLCCVCVVFVL
jgi:hypothetical protein